MVRKDYSTTDDEVQSCGFLWRTQSKSCSKDLWMMSSSSGRRSCSALYNQILKSCFPSVRYGRKITIALMSSCVIPSNKASSCAMKWRSMEGRKSVPKQYLIDCLDVKTPLASRHPARMLNDSCNTAFSQDGLASHALVHFSTLQSPLDIFDPTLPPSLVPPESLYWVARCSPITTLVGFKRQRSRLTWVPMTLATVIFYR